MTQEGPRGPRLVVDNEQGLNSQERNELIERLEKDLSNTLQELQVHTTQLEQLPPVERGDWSEGKFSRSLFEAEEMLAKVLAVPLAGGIVAMGTPFFIENPALQNMTMGGGAATVVGTAAIMGLGKTIFKLRSIIAKRRYGSQEHFA